MSKNKVFKPPPVPIRAILYGSEVVVFCIQSEQHSQLPVQRRSYNVIYGSGVNYGNTDLPFTSHQTDNWPVSCCYDRRRGREHCHACLHVLMQANGKWDQIHIKCCLWYMNRSQKFGCGETQNQRVCLLSCPHVLQQSYQLRPWSDSMSL